MTYCLGFIFIWNQQMAANLVPRSNGRSSWGGLELSQKAIAFIPYRGYHVSVYASDSRDGDPIKYFGSPLVLLNPGSAKYSFNRIREKHQVSFDVDMWNQDVEDYVIDHLNKLPNRPKTDSSHVQGIPFEEVILCSKVTSSMYELPSEWTPYQLDKKMTFTLYCPSEGKGRELAELLKSDRDFQTQFADCFRVNLSVTARESRRKDVKIKIENIISGKLCAELDQRFPDADQVLLTAQDTNTILSESVNNVLVDSFTDMKEVADPAAKNRIYSTLQTMLVLAQEKITSDSSKTWDSVFWRDENTRPDKVAKTLNESYNKSDNETKDRMKNAFSDSMSSNMNASLNVEGSARIWFLASANIKGKSQSSSSSSTSSSSMTDKENYDREMKEIADTVEWNGEKFVPKSMNLTRMNLSTIRNKQAFQDKEVVVSYSTAFLDLKMNVPEDAGFSSSNSIQTDSFSTIQMMKSDINELNRQVEGLKADLSNANSKITGLRTSSCIAALTSTRNEFEKEIEGLRASLSTSLEQMKELSKNQTPTFSSNNTSVAVPIFIASNKSTRFFPQSYAKYQSYNTYAQHGSFNPDSGIFTASTPGVYLLIFNAKTRTINVSCTAEASLLRNGGDTIAVSVAHQQPRLEQRLAISSIVELKKGDSIGIYIKFVGIPEISDVAYVHFSAVFLQAA